MVSRRGRHNLSTRIGLQPKSSPGADRRASTTADRRETATQHRKIARDGSKINKQNDGALDLLDGHQHRRPARGAHHLRALRRPGAADDAELLDAVHGRERNRKNNKKAAPLQTFNVPPRDPGLYDSGRSAPRCLDGDGAFIHETRGQREGVAAMASGVVSTPSGRRTRLHTRVRAQATSASTTARAANLYMAASSRTRPSTSSTRARGS